MSNLVDRELRRLRRERDQAQAEAGRLREELKRIEQVLEKVHSIAGETAYLMARAALEPAPGPAGERQGG